MSLTHLFHSLGICPNNWTSAQKVKACSLWHYLEQEGFENHLIPYQRGIGQLKCSILKL